MEALAPERRSRINKLKWHCRRALLELDLVFKRFWERHNDVIDEQTEVDLRELLAMEDHDLWAVISGKASLEPEESHLTGLVEELRSVRS